MKKDGETVDDCWAKFSRSLGTRNSVAVVTPMMGIGIIGKLKRSRTMNLVLKLYLTQAISF
jgi:hypothetical protein